MQADDPIDAVTRADPYPYDAIDAVTLADPYPYYAALVAGPPLQFDARRGLWLASSAAAVSAVLAHPDCRVRPPAEAVPAALAGSCAGQVFGALVRMNDGARHAGPKLALQRALAALAPEAVRRCALEVATELSAEHDLRDGAALDAWMFATPVQTVASLIGFPRRDGPALTASMRDFVACLSPLSDAAELAPAGSAAQRLLERFGALLDGNKGAARDGSLLQAVLREAASVGWDERPALLANLVGLLSQTYEATAGLIGNSIVALQRDPGLAQAVRAASGGAELLVRETGRYDAPIQNTRRFVARRSTVAGVDLEAGQAILVLLAAANRDPRACPRAAEFVLDRTAPSDHPGAAFGFGHGAHACPGRALASRIAAAALEIFLTIAPVRRAWTYRRSVNARVPLFGAQMDTIDYSRGEQQ